MKLLNSFLNYLSNNPEILVDIFKVLIIPCILGFIKFMIDLIKEVISMFIKNNKVMREEKIYLRPFFNKIKEEFYLATSTSNFLNIEIEKISGGYSLKDLMHVEDFILNFNIPEINLFLKDYDIFKKLSIREYIIFEELIKKYNNLVYDYDHSNYLIEEEIESSRNIAEYTGGFEQMYTLCFNYSHTTHLDIVGKFKNFYEELIINYKIYSKAFNIIFSDNNLFKKNELFLNKSCIKSRIEELEDYIELYNV